MNNRRNGDETRRIILEVSSRLFAEKGYRDTVHEEICRLANVNIGAINYHFRSKEKLYAEAWRQAFRQSLEKHPVDGGVSPDAPAEERLRSRILSIMRRMSDPENIEFEIIHKEMANPTGLLAEVMRESLDPLRADIQSIVRELIGKEASEIEVHLCEMSILGQCFNPLVMQMRHRNSLLPEDKFKSPDFDIETIATHVARFSMAGIMEIRSGTGKRRSRKNIQGKKLMFAKEASL